MTREKDTLTAESIRCNIVKYRKKIFPEHGGQKMFAQKYGISAGKFSKWESGHATPNEPDQRRLAEIFGISLAELRGDAPPMLTGDAAELAARVALAGELASAISRLVLLQKPILDGDLPAEQARAVVGVMNEVLDRAESFVQSDVREDSVNSAG